MKNKASWVIILLFALSSAYGQDTTIVKTDTIAIKFGCICNGLYRNKDDLDSCRYRIDQKNKQRLEQFKKTEEDQPNPCKDYYLPYIDFSKNNLLIVTGYYGGCIDPKIEYVLYKIISQKKYKLLYKVIDLGGCKALIPVKIKLLTSKFEEGYTFEQEVIEARQ